MNLVKINRIIASAGLLCRKTFSEAGPVVEVKVPGQNKAVCGLVPIDDKSDQKFAEYLIKEIRNELQRCESKKR